MIQYFGTSNQKFETLFVLGIIDTIFLKNIVLLALCQKYKNKLIFSNGWSTEVSNSQKRIVNCFGDLLDLEIKHKIVKDEKRTFLNRLC